MTGAARFDRGSTGRARRGKGWTRWGQDGVIGPWGASLWFALTPVTLLLVPYALDGEAHLFVLIAAVLVLLFPWAIARCVLVPLGQVRLAYWLAYTSDCAFRRDRTGGAALAGAWALARQPTRNAADANWLAGKLASEAALGGAGLLATGLLLAADDDLEGARRTIDGVARADGRTCPRTARRLAHAWLAGFAAANGDWPAVAELGRTLDQGGREAWLLSGVARRLLRDPRSPGRFGLWARWALAPRRRETLPLVRRALEPPAPPVAYPAAPVTPAAPAAWPRAPGGGTFDAALALHAAALARPAGRLRLERLLALARAWDAALNDPATSRWVAERAPALGTTLPVSMLERERVAIETDLANLALAAGVRLAQLEDRGKTAERVRALLGNRLLSDVENASIDDERREWMAFRALYARGTRLGGEGLRRLSYVRVYHDVGELAVWLWNDRQEGRLASYVYRWLLAEAEALGDVEATAQQRRNAGVTAADW